MSCEYIFLKGKNKDQLCGANIKDDHYCGRHSKIMIKKEDCIICMERGKLVSICINEHKFHKKCINTWKKSKNTCPICRIPLGVQPIQQAPNPISNVELERMDGRLSSLLGCLHIFVANGMEFQDLPFIRQRVIEMQNEVEPRLQFSHDVFLDSLYCKIMHLLALLEEL